MNVATYSQDNEIKILYPEGMKCDLCSSINIKDHEEGYVCGDCGIVFESQRFEYYRPYKEEALQHAVLSRTQIGTTRERLRSPHSVHLEKLNKLNLKEESEKMVTFRAMSEVRRIFEHLQLPRSKEESVLIKLKKLRSCLRPGTKFRNPEKLAPISIYVTMKLHNISINENDLLEISKITKKEFNGIKLQVRDYVPEYSGRDRKNYILQRIMEISEHFKLGMDFYYQSKKILYKLWNLINCTKDDVIAGLACSITALCCYQDREDVTVNAICSRLGIMMSTIQSQVKKRLIEKFKVPNFVSLVRSSDLLHKILVKLGLLKGEADLSIEKEQVAGEDPTKTKDEIVEIKFVGEKIHVIFPHDKKFDFYCFAVKDVNKHPMIIQIKTRVFEKMKSLRNRDSEHLLFEFESSRYYTDKDPP